MDHALVENPCHKLSYRGIYMFEAFLKWLKQMEYFCIPISS